MSDISDKVNGDSGQPSLKLYEGSLRTDFPDFWDAYLNFVARTQNSPQNLREITNSFYHNPDMKRYFTEIVDKSGGKLSSLFQDCIAELEGAMITREDGGSLSIVSGMQLREYGIPPGDEYDLPLDVFLSRNRIPQRTASKISNILRSDLKEKAPQFLIDVGGSVESIEGGYTYRGEEVITPRSVKKYFGLHYPDRKLTSLGDDGYEIIKDLILSENI